MFASLASCREVLIDGQSPTMNDRSRTTWTLPMHRYFIELMVDQVSKGNNNSQGFTKQAWIYMTRLFNARFGVQFTKDVLKNRHKTLKRLYNVVKQLLDQNGFTWDEQREMVVADDLVWNEYIKIHPEASKYRIRPVSNFDDLRVIFGNTVAAGRFNNSNHDALPGYDLLRIGAAGASGCQESPAKYRLHSAPFNDVPDQTSQSGGAMDISPQQSKRRSAAPSTSQRSGKARRGIEDGVMDAINEMAIALKTLADKNNNRNSENLIDALRAVPDIDDDLILDACDLLEDERKASMFLDMDVVLRRKWLMRKLRPLA